MIIVDKGVLPPSFMDFSIPTDFARSALFYSEQFGHFVCDNNYRVERDYLEQFLLVYVNSGELHIRCENKAEIIGKDQIGLLDCRLAHAYWCENKVDFFWFHYNGAASEAYYSHLNSRFGLCISGARLKSVRDDFLSVINAAKGALTNEHMISSNIHHILSVMASSDFNSPAVSSVLMPAISYIHNFYPEDISLDDMAKRCGVSKSHFIRTFMRYIGSTPHEYLVQYRLKQAKRLLLSTDLTAEQIAEQCGFNSASHFTRAFRGNTGITPRQFREIGF